MKKISILIVTLMVLFSTGCDNNFEEINQDPNRPTKVPAHLLLGSLIRVNQNTIYGMQQGGDMGMCWAQHVSKIQYNDEERYIPRRGSIDVIWDNLYASVISDAKSMYTLAEEENNTNLQAISLILQANAFQILTDLYGPVPFSEVFVKGVIKPKYDSQEAVYDGLIKQLTDADALLASGTGVVPASSDLLYAGNVSKWRKLANSLKLKALMRISKKKNVNAQLQALVNSGNLMSSTDDSAQITYLALPPDANPIHETIIASTRLEYKMSSVLVSKMSGLTDARLAVFASPNNANIIVGNVPGVENVSSYPAFSGLGTFYLNATLKGVILANSQVQFLLAEAANEGYISGGNAAALNYYNEAIKSSFKFNGIEAAANAYIAQPNISFTNQADARVKIGEQNWIALFGQGFEAWTEWRRTGYPALLPVANAAEATIPSRLYYNSVEVSLNNANYTSAVGTLTGGDQLTSRLWWMN